MNIRVYGALLLVLLLAACGRQLPEDGPATSGASSATTDVAAAPTETSEETVTDEQPTEEVDAEADEEVETDEAVDADTDVDEDADAESDDDPVTAAIAAGDPERGAEIFQTGYDTPNGQWNCASCHSVDASQVRLVGPGLWGLAERGEERIAESDDDTIPEYIHTSIVNPQAYIVPADEGGAYPENLMPVYDGVLSDEELDDLVAYILTLSE